MLRFRATKVKQGDIQPGDLLSTQGPEHWDKVPFHTCSCDMKHPIMARIMIAVNAEPEADEDDIDVYRLTLYVDSKHEEQQTSHAGWGPKEDDE